MVDENDTPFRLRILRVRRYQDQNSKVSVFAPFEVWLFSEEVGEPPRPGGAPFEVRAALAGSPEGPWREFARDHPFCRPDRLNHLPPVPGLGLDVAADAVRDVLDVAAGDGVAEGLVEAGYITGDPEPVGGVDPGLRRGARPGDGEGAILEDLIDSPPDAEGVGLDGEVDLDGPLPFGLAAGGYALVEEFPGFFPCFGEDAEDLLPDLLRFRSSPRCVETCLQTV
jgi:hypothetical protein